MYYIRSQNHIGKCLDIDTARTVVNALVTLHLDFANIIFFRWYRNLNQVLTEGSKCNDDNCGQWKKSVEKIIKTQIISIYHQN